MGEVTKISWCDATINFWMGCTKVSPACDGCYAEALMDKRYHKVTWGGTRVRTGAHTWNDPLRWQKKAEAEGKRPFVFASSLSDIFDNQVPVQWRVDAFEVMRKTPNLVYLLLTKRPQNIIKMAEAAGGLPRNAALGATCEDQKRFDINAPHLIAAKKAMDPQFIFLSSEPLLGDIIAGDLIHDIDWIITGGETDQGEHKARISQVEWFRSLRDQAAAAGKAYHHKQNGEWLQWGQVMEDGLENYLSFGKKDDKFQHVSPTFYSKVGKSRSGRMIDGVAHDAFPEPR